MNQPNNLDEAIEFLLAEIRQSDKDIDALERYEGNEDGFIGQLHHFTGRNIRNAWNLWWSKSGAKQYDEWPKEKPAIVQYFNDLGIYHADDMSGIILTSLYRKYFNLPIELEEQIKVYKEHWEEQGVDVTQMAE